jgi:hypothetical protein
VGTISPPSGSSAHGKEKEKEKEKSKNVSNNLNIFLRKFSGDPPYAK